MSQENYCQRPRIYAGMELGLMYELHILQY